MLQPDQTLDMTPIGAIFHVKKTPEQTNGQSLELEWELIANSSGTPVHIHPFANETYKVLEGKLELNIDGKWKMLQQGEELTVPKGVPHTFRNPIASVTRVYNTHSPAMQFDDYFEGLSNIVNKLSIGGKEKLKMNFNTLIHICMLMKKFEAEIVPVNPPKFIVSVMNAIGRLKGIKV